MTRIVEAEEFRLLDSEGRLRARLGFDGASSVSLQIHDIAGGAPRVDISVDAIGCHVLLANPARQQTYLFLKDSGATGLVLTDVVHERRAHFMLSPDGRVEVSVAGTAGATGSGSGTT